MAITRSSATIGSKSMDTCRDILVRVIKYAPRLPTLTSIFRNYGHLNPIRRRFHADADDFLAIGRRRHRPLRV